MTSIRPTTNPDHSASLWIALVLSVLIHIPLLYPLGQIAFDDEPYHPAPSESETALSLTLVEEEEPEEEKKEKERDEDETLQFVSAPPPDVEKRPDQAKFLDQYESETPKQMVRKAAPGAPLLVKASNQARKVLPERPQIPQPDPPSKQAQLEKEVEKENPTEDDQGELAKATAEPVDMRRDQNKPEASGTPNPRQLFPNLQNTRIVNPRGQDGSMDYLRDVDEGDKTLLNRKRSRYWAFFDRVKVQIADEWSPAAEYRRRDPYGNVYGVKDRFSAVRVTLNSDGTVRQLFVSRPSGLDFFDDEAIRSIRAAAPFHNPPEGLKDEDGLIHFTFGFFFEITSGTSLRVFR